LARTNARVDAFDHAGAARVESTDFASHAFDFPGFSPEGV
jgi:hypothetical protein